jgi:flagellin
MARINTNVPSVIAQANYNRTQKDLALRLERLSTGLRINRGKDDPAGLIISERLRANIQGVDQGIRNSERANTVISTAESGLNEVNDLLNSIKSLIVESANLTSREERDANQLQLDSAIDSITRISNTASFGSLKLLNGSLDYKLSGIATSAITSTKVTNASFLNAKNLQVNIDVIGSAQVGSLFYRGEPGATGRIMSAMTLEVRGTRGVEVLSFAIDTPLSSVVRAVNNTGDLTGVRARLVNPTTSLSGMVFESGDFGSDSFVSVKRQGGPTDSSNSWKCYQCIDNTPVPTGTPFPWTTIGSTLRAAVEDSGKDVQALVNGNLANGRGLRVIVNSGPFGGDFLLNADFATRPNTAPTTFYVTGGGAQFQLGPDVNALQQANLGIPSVAASSLGATDIDGTLMYLSSLKSGQANDINSSYARRDFTAASDILNGAIDDISVLRGRLGAFGKNVLDTNIRSLQASLENLTASDSQIRDADFAVETSKLTRAQILSSAGTSTLALANQQSQQVLQLLG